MVLTRIWYGTKVATKDGGRDRGWAGLAESGCSHPRSTICRALLLSDRPAIISTSGVIRKDPSAENQASCFVRILQNSRQVWPAEGWAKFSRSTTPPPRYEITNLRVSAGDKIRFIVKHNGENRADPDCGTRRSSFKIRRTLLTDNRRIFLAGRLENDLRAAPIAPVHRVASRSLHRTNAEVLRLLEKISRDYAGLELLAQHADEFLGRTLFQPRENRGSEAAGFAVNCGCAARNSFTSARLVSSKVRARLRTRSRLSSAITARSSAGCTGDP